MGAPGYGPGVPSMRPQYRPEMRGPGQVQRPVSYIYDNFQAIVAPYFTNNV